jgi:hypothetical protein
LNPSWYDLLCAPPEVEHPAAIIGKASTASTRAFVNGLRLSGHLFMHTTVARTLFANWFSDLGRVALAAIHKFGACNRVNRREAMTTYFEIIFFVGIGGVIVWILASCGIVIVGFITAAINSFGSALGRSRGRAINRSLDSAAPLTPRANRRLYKATMAIQRQEAQAATQREQAARLVAQRQERYQQWKRETGIGQ